MDQEDRIRMRAYDLWIAEGCPRGREKEHWERAAAEIEAFGLQKTVVQTWRPRRNPSRKRWKQIQPWRAVPPEAQLDPPSGAVEKSSRFPSAFHQEISNVSAH